MVDYNIPPRWKNCPRKGEIVQGKFLPFKTPLDQKYFNNLDLVYYFTPEMLISSLKQNNIQLGLWIDLTNTTRYYDKDIITTEGIKFCKLKLKGHDGPPSVEQTKAFIQLCNNFNENYPDKIIAVHCTHGFNRTGFLICSFLCEQLFWSPDAALSIFSASRPPGIYKQDYILELFKRYGNDLDVPQAPIKPNWCFENEDLDDDGNKLELNKSDIDFEKKIIQKKSTFMDGINGVEIVTNGKLYQQIQNTVAEMCKYNKKDFLGSQPVSMAIDDLAKIRDMPYKVSWKADGVRYLMLIEGEQNVYFLDRDNAVFKIVEGCPRFPRRKNLREHLTKTLVDGEMIIDVVNGVKCPMFLIYDILKFEGISIFKDTFDKRELCIYNEIIIPRNQAKIKNIIDRSQELFSIRLKEFWDLKYTKALLGEKFNKDLKHEVDGLIFQPVDKPYVFGAFNLLLKWKPPTLNSIDFKLKIFRENNQGCLPETYACLYVGHLNELFAKIKATKEFRENDNKIVECTYDYEKKTWKFLRVRTDKSFPNSSKTAKAVLETIKNPLTKEFLLNFIDKYSYSKFHNFDSRSNESKSLMLPPPPKKIKN